jgi:FdhD protein
MPTDPATSRSEMKSIRPIQLLRLRGAETARNEQDDVAVEEPLEIRVEGHSVAVVMRTPGNDRELAAGFLLTENIVRCAGDIFEITLCGTPASASDEANIANVTLKNPQAFDTGKLTRHLFSSSSCGICGKASIEAIRQQFPAITSDWRVSARLLGQLPERLSHAQPAFQRTGGLHACALFTEKGEPIASREDIGRHNALDKLIGHALLENRLPLEREILVLSGRVSFEMMQKALAGGIGMIAAISAPSSLAVEFAHANNQTLVGFLRGERMNIYAGMERVVR